MRKIWEQLGEGKTMIKICYMKKLLPIKKKSSSRLEEIFIQLSFVVKVADIEIMFLSYVGRHFILK